MRPGWAAGVTTVGTVSLAGEERWPGRNEWAVSLCVGPGTFLYAQTQLLQSSPSLVPSVLASSFSFKLAMKGKFKKQI